MSRLRQVKLRDAGAWDAIRSLFVWWYVLRLRFKVLRRNAAHALSDPIYGYAILTPGLGVERLVQLLAHALQDSDECLSTDALRALERLTWQEALTPIVDRFAFDELVKFTPNLHKFGTMDTYFMVNILSRLGNPLAFEPLLAMLTTERIPKNRATISNGIVDLMNQMRSSCSQEFVHRVTSSVIDVFDGANGGVAVALLMIGTEDAMKLVLKFFKDGPVESVIYLLNERDRMPKEIRWMPANDLERLALELADRRKKAHDKASHAGITEKEALRDRSIEVVVGMDSSDVIALLGRPVSIVSGSEVLGAVGAREGWMSERLGDEFWHYDLTECKCSIIITAGKVRKVERRPKS